MPPLAAQKHFFFVLTDGLRADGVAHTPLAHHLAGHFRRPLNIVARTRGHFVHDQFLGHATAQEHHQIIAQEGAGITVPIFVGQLHGHAQGAAARDDGHLVNGVGAGQHLGGQGVTGLMIGGDALFVVAEDEAAPFLAHEHLVLGVLEVRHVQTVLVQFGGLQSGLVDQVFKVRAGKTGRPLGQNLKIDIVAQRGAPGVHLKNTLTAAQVGGGHHHLAIETAGAQQGGVQHVGPVGGRNEDDALVGLEAVHFHQQLVESLFPLVMTSAQARAALAAHGVDFVDENEAGRVLLALSEQIAHARGAHAHEHFHKIRTRDGKEGHPGLARHGAGQQRLAGARRADEQHAFGNAAAQAGKLARIGQKLDHFGQFLFGLIHARHVGKGDAALLLGNHARSGTAEGHGFAAAPLHLAHEENPHPDEQQHGEPRNKQGHEQRRVFGRLGLDDHLAFKQMIHQAGIVRGVGLKGRVVLRLALDDLPLNTHFLHIPAVHLGQKIAVGQGRLLGIGLAEQIEEDDHRQRDDHPEQEVAGKLVQSCLRGCLMVSIVNPDGTGNKQRPGYRIFRRTIFFSCNASSGV